MLFAKDMYASSALFIPGTWSNTRVKSCSLNAARSSSRDSLFSRCSCHPIPVVGEKRHCDTSSSSRGFFGCGEGPVDSEATVAAIPVGIGTISGGAADTGIVVECVEEA
jgi:hypothetical protein